MSRSARPLRGPREICLRSAAKPRCGKGWGSALVLAMASVLAAQELSAQLQEAAITGRVMAVDDETPISQADVRLDGTQLAVLTGPDGRFRLNRVPAGNHVLRVERLGYETRVDSITVTAGTVVELQILLSIEPIELEPLVAVIRSLVLERAGFYARKAQGFGGTFLDPQEIRSQRPSMTTDLFRSLPGIRVSYGGIYGSQVLVNQRVTFTDDPMGCVPELWLDGIRSTMRSYDMMRVDEIEGVEVYAGGGPGKFNDVCGSILIWTKVPINR